MSDKLKKRPVVLEVVGEVIFAQRRLPPGFYTGEQQVAGVRTGAGIQWSEPTYFLKLATDQLAALGWDNSATQGYVAQNVTASVRSGSIIVHL